MATAVVKDYVLWVKHIRDDPQLVHRVLEMRAGETIELIVDGIPGTWAKMADGYRGLATAGLKPMDRMKKVWGGFFRDRKDEIVELRAPDMPGESSRRRAAIPIRPPLARSEEERKAAFEALMRIADQGWTSEAPYGPRDELYER